jgi:putative ribosome biogenesis GTPase RsgA
MLKKRVRGCRIEGCRHGKCSRCRITYAIKQRAIKKLEKKRVRRFWRRDDDEYYCRGRSSAGADS